MTKNEAISLIQELPDNVTLPEIVEALQIRERNLQAIASLEAGKGISQEEVDRIVDRWLEE